MISDVKDINICIVLLLVAFYEAASFPQPNGNSKAFHSRRDDVISGSVEIKEDGIEGNINIPNNPQQLAEEESAENGAVVGSIEINKDEVVGSISIPSGNGQGDNQHQSLDEHNEKAEGGVTTSIYQGVEIDGQDKKAEVLNNEVTQDGALSGTIEINDKNIEGNINIPSVEVDLSESGQEALETPGTGDFITGNIKINSEFIEGTIEVPSDTNDNDQVNADGVNNDGKQPHGGTITGSIEINDKAIEGHVDFPTDYEGSLAKETKDDVGYSKEVNSDVLTGSIEIGDEHIEGHVEMPSGVENDIEGEPNVSGANGPDKALSGTVEINDAGIQGHIDLPSEDDLVSSDENNSEDIAYAPITGTMKGWSHNPAMDKSCWMTLNAKHHMNALDDLDSTYKTDRQKYQEDIGKEFDKKMMEVLLTSQGKAPRAIHQAEGDPSQIPAGLALGGTCMMRMKGSVLFFHRMKLRNSTRFTVNFLNTDLVNMVQITRLSLNDLHLKGAYERLTSDRDPATLFYVPNFGEIEVLLKNVVYKMEGHLRMMNNRLTIELVNSDLITKDILMTYVNSNDSAPIVLQPRNIEDFLERLKTDLDFWLKDYFNDYLMYFGIVGKGTKVLEYEKKKTIRVNEYADDVVKSIKKRIKDLGAASVKLPHFTIFSVLNTEFKLLDGVLRGLDSIYRRSVATTKKTGKIRQLDFIAGFSELKVEYKYEALVSPNMPPISGKLIMSADEITAHIEMAHLSEPETIDIQLDTIIQTKPESLTVEGPVNRLIANFKALLEHPVIAIMSNTMKHNIKMMKTLTRCDPYIYGKEERISDDDPVLYSVNAPHQTDNDIEDDEGQSSASSSGNSDLGDGHDNDGGTETSKNDKDSSDYVLSKNDSLEIQVPVKGKEKSYKLHRNEKLVLKKVDKYMK